MPRWLRVVRGMLGTGLTFAVGVGGAVAIVGTVAWLFGELTVLEVLQSAGKLSVVSFLLGVLFSGVLALTAHGSQFSKLSLRFVLALGTGAGWLYWIFLASTGGRSWAPRLAIMNFVLLTIMGAGSAGATFLIARRAGAPMGSGGDPQSLGAGDDARVPSRNRSTAEVPER